MFDEKSIFKSKTTLGHRRCAEFELSSYSCLILRKCCFRDPLITDRSIFRSVSLESDLMTRLSQLVSNPSQILHIRMVRELETNIYVNVAARNFKSDTHLDPLSSVFGEKSVPLPSWVPDWTQSGYFLLEATAVVRNGIYCASGNTTSGAT